MRRSFVHFPLVRVQLAVGPKEIRADVASKDSAEMRFLQVMSFVMRIREVPTTFLAAKTSGVVEFAIRLDSRAVFMLKFKT